MSNTNANLARGAQESINTAGSLKALVASLEKYREVVSQVMPKGGIGVERVLSIAAHQIKSNEKLLACSHASIISAIIQAAMTGLDCRTSANEVYFIPFKGECTLQYGYAGLINLAYRSGMVSSIQAYCVYEGDYFEHEMGHSETIHHRMGQNFGDPSKVTHAYSVCYMRGSDRPVMEVITKRQIERLKAKGQGGSSWADYDEMAKAKVIKRLCKKLPKSVEWSDLLQWDGAIAPDLNSYDKGGRGIMVDPVFPDQEDPIDKGRAEEVKP